MAGTRVKPIQALAGALVLALVASCGAPEGTPRITPGSAAHPRPVVIVAKDYTFVPAIVDLVPGETVVLQVINGGLVVHEAVLGDASAQDAWESAEAELAGAPPGATPLASLATDTDGVRVVVASGQRVDVVWMVPPDAASVPASSSPAGSNRRSGWFVGCHIPGHLAEGMIVPIRFVGADGLPLPTR